MKSARAQWYVDADTLGLAHVLKHCRRDVTFCGDDGIRDKPSWKLPPCVIQDTETGDDVWIPEVTRAGLAIISRDRRIATRTAEKNAVLSSNARMFAITSPENLDVWGLVEVVVTRWREMEIAAEEPGPYIYSLTRSGRLEKIDLFKDRS